MGTTVAITGAGGRIARELIPRLVTSSRVDRVVGLDVVAPAGLPDSPKLQLTVTDVRDPGLADLLAGCDVVVHLAFLMDQTVDRGEMRSINVDGTRNVVQSARQAGVGMVVYLSSAVAYGAHPDNDVPLDEDTPLRANVGFGYAEDKRDIEQWLASWVEEHPEVRMVILRPWVIAGWDVDNWFVRHLVEGVTLGIPRVFAVKGYRPPWQFSHVEDVASAIEHAIEHEQLAGPYNVACEGWLSYDEFLSITGKKPLQVPEGEAHMLAERLWRLDLVGGPPASVSYLMHPVVLSVERLLATGWRPKHTNRDALRELAASHAGWVHVKHGVRLRTRTLRLAAAGLLLLLLTVAGAAVRRARG
ncbi:MAG TPA: NAD-dependent epimerase/dehydratase family protein [Nitriliruptorales bacterium]|nr:NAD-dependent epimerase/dehydratase family protein [Nitriliruptorales bacterium]